MKQHGLTLVELMISMALTLVLTLGVFSLLSSSQRSYMAQRELALIQENAVFVKKFLAEPLREVGFARGCTQSADFANAVVWPAGTQPFNFFSQGIRAWPSGQLPAGMTLNPAPLAGSEVLQIQGINALDDLRAAVSTQGNSARVDLLNATHPVQEGDLMLLISDQCQQMTLFVAKNSGGQNQAHIIMNTGTVKDSPLTNCTRHLMGNYDCDNHAAQSSNDGLPSEADVFRARNDIYYLANAVGSSQPSLFRHDIVRGQTHELVQGVSNLSFVFALSGPDRAQGMRQVNRYASANQLNTPSSGLAWDDVIGVELRFRMVGRELTDIFRDYSQFIAMRNKQAQ